MGQKILKTGTPITVKDTGKKSTIARIENGCYYLASSKRAYSAGDLVADKIAPEKKPRQRINPVSTNLAKLKPIYKILSEDFLRSQKRCRARFAGCTEVATETHHRYKRTGFWLIVARLFFPICNSCHKYATEHSREAIESGVSISRTADMKYSFSSRELKLMQEAAINPPE